MPLINLNEINTSCCWGLWHITESVDELVDTLQSPPHCLDFLHKINHPEKQKESLSARIVAKQILEHWQIEYPGIQKNELDKPFLCDINLQVSLSHAPDYGIAIIHKNQDTGIDMEQIRDKVRRISKKFLSPHEKDFAGQNLDKLTIIWVVKEAIYKLYGKKKISFSANIHTTPFEVAEQGMIKTKLILPEGTEKMYDVHYLKFKNYYLAYAF